FAGTPPDMPTKEKKLYLTVFLQGFFNGTDMDKVVADATGPTYQWAGTIVDTVTVELHDAADYTNIVYTAYGVNLNQDGTTNTGAKTYVSIPSSFNGSYYITVKHRSHIETTTFDVVPFNTATINYNFTTAANQAFGSNMKETAPSSGIFALYSGDINQDGLVNLTDLSAVNFSALQIETGYLVNDLNGDGLVNLTDLSAVNFNALQLVAKNTP
ncbi:MAG: hypothetical protein ACOYOV_17125, partial [Bacteroidales bacterium]